VSTEPVEGSSPTTAVTSGVVVEVVAVAFCLTEMADVNKGMPGRLLKVSLERVLDRVPETGKSVLNVEEDWVDTHVVSRAKGRRINSKNIIRKLRRESKTKLYNWQLLAYNHC